MSHRTRSVIIVPLLIIVVISLTGCVSGALRSVHDTYRSEFQAQLEQSSSFTTAEDGAVALQAERFPVTLSAIATFRQQYPNNNDAIKHLTVLEAMIYLQTQRYGHASLAAKTADELPGSLTTFGGGLTRDELLLRAMRPSSGPGLIEAWEMLAPAGGSTLITNAGLESSAQHLKSVAASDQVPEGDEGRLYIAAVYALVRMKQLSRDIIFAESNNQADQVPAIKRKYGQLIVAALDPHLLPHEKLADAADVTELSDWSIRYRYVRIYQIGLALETTVED